MGDSVFFGCFWSNSTAVVTFLRVGVLTLDVWDPCIAMMGVVGSKMTSIVKSSKVLSILLLHLVWLM